MQFTIHLLLPLILVMALTQMSHSQEKTLVYPHSKRLDLVERQHGVDVPDPYRWLEADLRESKEVAQWIKSQNSVTQKFLKAIAGREAIEARLRELWDYEKLSTPFKAGGHWYLMKNDGTQNQSVLHEMKTSGEPGRTIIDPNTWSDDGTSAMADFKFSSGGKFLAFSVQESGSDWRTWKILRLHDLKILEDKIEWAKFSTIAWTKDAKGFFYCRYDAPGSDSTFQSLNYNQKIFYHQVGDLQSEDDLVFERPDHPDWGFAPIVSRDGHFLIVTVWKGTADRYQVLYRDLRKPYGTLKAVIDKFENQYNFIANDGHHFYFQTDLDAPLGRVVKIDARNPAKVVEVIPQSNKTLEGVRAVGNLFILQYLREASSEVAFFRRDGHHLRNLKLPGIGSAEGFTGDDQSTATYFSFSSFATPPSIYKYDLLTNDLQLVRQSKVAFDPDDFTVTQTRAVSKDGTQVPMFIAHKLGIKLDGSNPTLLYGYGGFNMSLTPTFSLSRLAWMDMGGILVVANLRGGGEFGESWHEAGTKLKKQNVFDDFVACAESLIASKYTSPEKLAIQGGSNGGLLVGACLCQRPELFAACLPAVGVMDMLRFHKFTAGRFWVDDYGSPDNPEEFAALLAYSPYHNLRVGKRYPATLVTTADTDDRVVPGHSFKFAAALQHAQKGKAPVLIRIEEKAGHGAGKPVSKQIEEIADLWAFLAKALKMDLPSR